MSGGCHIKIIGAKLLLEQALKAGRRYAHVALDLKNAHNSYSRRRCQEALNAAAADNPALTPLARAHHFDCGQPGDIFMRTGGGGQKNGFKHLCTSFVGGPQGSALTNLAFPMTINAALKKTEEKFPGVTVRAIQDDCDIMGDPDLIFGTNGDQGALQYLLDELKTAGLEPNVQKFQALATPTARDAVPNWLKQPSVITCPVQRERVATTSVLAEAAAAEASAATDEEREAAAVKAGEAAEAAAEAARAVPEHHKAYGVIVCGAALGDKEFEAAFLEEQRTRIVNSIKSVSTTLATDSAHAASTAIYYSLQCRADFLLETHLPSLTRNLARSVDEALRGAYATAFGIDILNPEGHLRNQRDPTFLRDLAGLKAKAGGCGYRNTERRAVFLNALNNALPQIAGTESAPTLWPELVTLLGEDSFKKDNEETRWQAFFASDSAWATEMQSEITRVKGLRNAALAEAGLSASPPEHAVFDASPMGFGACIKKLHRVLFDDIRAHEATALHRRASLLRPNDQRRMAFQQSHTYRFSNVLFAGPPSIHTRFTNKEFHVAVQSVVGAPLSILRQSTGQPIKSPTTGSTVSTVDHFGNNLKKLKAAPGGGTLQNHNSLVNLLSYWLRRTSIPHRGGKHGKPQTCKDLFVRATTRHRLGQEDQNRLHEIIPDLMIDGRFLSPTIEGPGCLLQGTKTLVDVKTKSCNEDYAAERTGTAGAVTNKRQEKVNHDYHKKAEGIDTSQGTAAGTTGPFKSELNGYGQNGRVLAPVVGAFAEMSKDTYIITDLIASVLAEEHCSYFFEAPSAAKGLFTQRLYRSLGLSSHLGWARLLLDRYQDLVETPHLQSQRTSGDGQRPSLDDEDAFEHEMFHNPDTPYHAH